MRIMLVYQAGLANVFEVDCYNVRHAGREYAKRLYQGDFYGAVMFCRGAGHLGAIVRTVHCTIGSWWTSL